MREVWIAKPESLRESGVIEKEKGGKESEVGDNEDGELPFIVELVDGLGSVFGGRKALNTWGRPPALDSLSPNEAELRLAYFARELGAAIPLNTPGFSDEKASNGKDSKAYAGGPAGTPYRL